MSNPGNRVEKAMALGEFVESLEGKVVRISQLISWRPGSDFERHSSILVRLSFRVEKASWAISGGHFTLRDDGDTVYSFGTTMLQDFEINGDTATITELYGTGAERRSIVQVVAGAA